MTTIGDVAKRAGVSRSTASYAFSGKRPISEPVRARVLAAAAEIGFTANAGARALATSQTRVIGLFAEFLPDEFAPAMLQYILGVSNAARERGYDVLMVTDPDGPAALHRISESRMVDGIVLLNVAEDDSRLPVLRAARQPGALVGLPADSTGVDVFDLDFEAAGRQMVLHLADLGHEEILLVSQPELVVERGGAYVWRLRDAAMAAAIERNLTLHHAFGAAQQPEIGAELHALLDRYPTVTAIMINNEAAAAALPSVLHERGSQSPADLSVIGRYSDEFARTFSLPYTSVESAPDRLGRLAVEQLVDRIENPLAEAGPSVCTLLDPIIVDRGSTDRPPQH